MKKQKWLFILLISGVIISGIIFSFYTKSKISSIRDLRSSIKEFDISRKQAAVEESDASRNLHELIPETDGITGFIENIYRISVRRSLKHLTLDYKDREFIELNTGKLLKAIPVSEQKLSAQKPKVLYSYPMKIHFYSGYREMAEFIREVQSQPRLVTIEDLKVKPEKSLLSVEMTIHIYSTEGK